MVLDIRHLPEPAAGPAPPPAPPAGEADAHLLEGLLTAAAEGPPAERAAAFGRLRVLVPSGQGTTWLCRIAADADDPRRLVAIHMLGFHRQWLFSRSAVQLVLSWARSEQEPAAAAALVWVLRQRDAVQEFLLHPILPMAREAALGLPVNRQTVDAVLDALLVGRGADVDRVLETKLRATHPSLAQRAVEHLLAVAGRVTADALSQVLSHLPQEPLFELFVEGRGRPAWSGEPTREETQRSRQWHHLARQAAQVLRAQPRAELIRYLVNRSAADEAFARRHAEFLKAAMGTTAEVLGPEVLDDLERLTAGASEDRLERMARLLIDLGGRIAGGDSHAQAVELLEKWKRHSPALKLKIFHLQQGLS